MATQNSERQVAPFILSLIAGILILVGSVMAMSFRAGVPYSGGMMGNYYGGMMGGYYGMMNGYYGMMQGFGLGGGWGFAIVAVGAISGIIILIGAIMINNEPTKATTWGALILVFSIVSLLGMGGFFLGAILGVVGGVLATASTKSRAM